MQLNQGDFDRLIPLTLSIEAAGASEDWPQVNQLLTARGVILDQGPLPESVYTEVRAIDERMLTELRKGLAGVKKDLRNLSAALKVASPYAKQGQGASISLAS